MPPAFNLSQDQTLQFNPTKHHNSLTVILITSMDLSIRVIALILFATCVTSHQDTHTYRLSKFLKINSLRRLVKFVSSKEARL
jgi:hypothetical protein